MKKKWIVFVIVVLLLALMVTTVSAMWGSGVKPPAEQVHRAPAIAPVEQPPVEQPPAQQSPVEQPPAEAAEDPADSHFLTDGQDGIPKSQFAPPRPIITPYPTLPPVSTATLPAYPYPYPEPTVEYPYP